MGAFTRGFADELEKLAAHGESGMDVVMAEALGPIPSAVSGYRAQGLKGALNGGGGYIALRVSVRSSQRKQEHCGNGPSSPCSRCGLAAFI